MKKLLILIAAIPFFASAQESNKTKTTKMIFVGFSFSPDYCYRTLNNNDGSSSSDYVINSRNDIEKGKFSYTTGINVNLKLGEKLEFQTGVSYSNKGYRSPKREAFYPAPPPRPGEPTHIKSVVNFNYLDIPFKLNYLSARGQVKFIAGAGIAAGLLLKESDVYTLFYADGGKKEVDNNNAYDHDNLNLFALISAGLEFNLKENFQFRAEPSFKYGILKTIDDVPVSERLWNIGLTMSIYFKLK